MFGRTASHLTPPVELLPLQEVMRVTSMSRSTIYARMAIGQFPKPVRVAAQSVRWKTCEIHEWIASLPRAGSRGPVR